MRRSFLQAGGGVLRALAGGLLSLASCFHPTPLEPLAATAIERDHEPAADVAPPPGWRFDEPTALAYALAHGGAAVDRRDQEAVAEARIAAARNLTDPEIHIGRSSEQGLLGDESTRFVIALRVFPDMPWALDARVARARADYEAERAITTTARRALAAQLAQGYAQLAFAHATRELLDKAGGVLAERRRVLAAQLAHNTTTQLELVLAEQDAGEVAAALSAIELAETRERATLAQLIGIPAGQDWTPVWEIERQRAIHVGLARETLSAAALRGPALAALTARANAADAAAYEAHTARMPWIKSLQVERSVRDTVEWAASATISLPLFSWNAAAAADAERSRAGHLRRQYAVDTARQVEDAIALVEATGRRARTLAEQLGPAGVQIDALLAAEKSAAIADPVKLLLLEERHVRAERAMLDAACEHRMAVIALEALTGEPLP